MIRIDSVWLAVAPLDMRAGTDAALARVVGVFGTARPHHAYLFANRRANRSPRKAQIWMTFGANGASVSLAAAVAAAHAPAGVARFNGR